MSSVQQQQQAKASKRELQGPRPAPLKIWKDSHKIRKPTMPVPAMAYRPPVIIYTRSPEVIHSEAQEFMTLVQRLTGRVNAHGDSSMPPSSSSSFQSQNSHALPYSHTSVPGNPNFVEIDASPSPPRRGPDFPVKEDNSIATLSSPSDLSGNNRSQYSSISVSPTIQYGSMSPLSPNFFLPSPNFFLPSPPLLSPNIFHEFPLCTPQPDYCYSPYSNLMRMQSEPIFTPNAINPVSSSSPLPTDCDLFNHSNSW